MPAISKIAIFPFRVFWWAITFQLGRQLQLRRDYRLLAESGLFDPQFYLQNAHDLAATRVDPLRHYLSHGAIERRDPHPLFDTRWYLTQSHEARLAGGNPLAHYLTVGWKEGYNPHPLFDGNWYLQHNPDVAASGLNPLVHYVRQGWREGRKPHLLFDTTFYLERNPDIAKAGTEPLSHYVLRGGFESRDPHPLFDSNWYLRQYPDLNRSGVIPLVHYLQGGSGRRSSPHPLFDTEFYIVHHPDAATTELDPLRHYLIAGAARRYNPHPLFDNDFYLNQCSFAEAEFIDPLLHYVQIGAITGLDPCELFDSSFYLEQYPDVRDAGLNPLAHFWTEGAITGYKPNPLFDTSFYLKQYPAIAIARVNPLLDFIDWGAAEGRFPNPFFDPSFYLRNNPDVKNAGWNPLAHYLESGAKEGRDPSPFFVTKRYISEHPEVDASDINPLAHFLGYSNQVSPQNTSLSSGDSGEIFAVLLPTDISDCGFPELPNCPSALPCKSITVANEAFRRASDSDCHLLIVLGPLALDKKAVVQLVESFSLDPHFCAAMPRQSHPVTGEILKLSNERGDPEINTLSPQVLTEITTPYILPEILSSCLVLRNSVISNLGYLDDTYETVAGALQQYLCRARRCGFRCIVLNNAVVSAALDSNSWMVQLKGRDLVRVHTEYLDIGEAKLQFMSHPLHRHESLLARALSPKQCVRNTLLIDTRGIPNQINGTSEAVLGVCDGLRQLNAPWRTSLLATPDAASYHNLLERYPDWEITDDKSERLFTAVLRPSQPWNLTSLIDLHRRALFCFCSILDTIAWDILFVAPPGLSAAWNFLSSYADGILYISKYTRDRFILRFPQAQNTPAHVSYLSLNPRDYKNRVPDGTITDEEFILVVGNGYDHKNVAPTVDLLASKFPDRRIKAFGIRAHASSSVECIESGQIRQADVDALFAKANLVIFPSFYEGFGLPILKGLSNGQTVIARRSDLLYEIAANYRGPGRLMEFRNPTDLVDAVERVISGLEVHELPLGGAVNSNDEPLDWKGVASGVLRFIEDRVQRTNQRRWEARQMAIEQIESHSR